MIPLKTDAAYPQQYANKQQYHKNPFPSDRPGHQPPITGAATGATPLIAPITTSILPVPSPKTCPQPPNAMTIACSSDSLYQPRDKTNKMSGAKRQNTVDTMNSIIETSNNGRLPVSITNGPEKDLSQCQPSGGKPQFAPSTRVGDGLPWLAD